MAQVAGFDSPPSHLDMKTMKDQTEKKVENAVKALMETLQRSLEDTGLVLGEFEAEHDEAESDRSKSYQALVAGHYALAWAIERINKQLNK